MAQKISITLEENLLAYIDSQTQNRSKFINEVLAKSCKEQQLQELRDAYIKQAQDEDEQKEIDLWDSTAGDNLANEAD
ncbi:MAG: hypothetical protein QNJ18_19665 [Xenococcaceae cyanobacterium MO_167.B52]|nr:hypothetical protein [Xenococcaceae cyanobacterium MO_167.B52]